MKLPKHRRDQAALNSRLIRRPIKRMVWLFLLPTFGAFCIGFLYPFFKGLFLSFCNFRITSQWTWTGLDNYRKAFQDPGYMHAFWYTALFALVSLLAINLFAFTIAYALTQKFKGTNVFRTVFFLPNLIGGIVLGYIWSMIFDGILIKYNTSVILETNIRLLGSGDPGVLAADRLYDDHLYRRTPGRARGYAGGGHASTAPTAGRPCGGSPSPT